MIVSEKEEFSSPVAREILAVSLPRTLPGTTKEYPKILNNNKVSLY
jgi:hypothetical protein